LGDLAAALGRHYAEAGDLERAIEYYTQAGERARCVYAYHEAIDHYRHVLTLLKEQGPAELTCAARTAMTLGQLYHTVFDFEHSQQAYQEGFALWQRVEEEQSKVRLPPAPHALRLPRVGVRCLDLTATVWGQCHAIIQQLFSGLVECTPELDIVPDLARSWDILDQGRRYVFHLRPDVRWSDGRPVTAHDFEFTWKYQLNPANPFVGELLFDIKNARACYEGRAQPDDVGVLATDDHTLVVELEEPVGHFLDFLAYSVTFAIPRHAVEAHGERWATEANIITNGPFRLESWRPDEGIVLVRNPDYHGRASGNVMRIELTLSDHWTTDSILKFYEAGACDACEVLSYRTTREIEQIRQQHASEYVGTPHAHTSFVSFDARVPPFDDVRVRQAFVHALDRVTMTNTLFGNYRTPATGGFVPPGLPGHSAGIGLPYDPVRARQLLAEAGYADGHGLPKLEAWSPSTSEVPPHVRYMTQQWRDVLGIDIHWTFMDWHDWQEQRRGQVTHLFCSGWVADYPDPSSCLSTGVHFYTWPLWRNRDYEQLLDRARRMTDLAERIKIYRAAERILIQEAVIVPLSYGRQHLLVKPWIKRYPITPLKATYWKDVIIEAH
jgi:ABC-type oligopeptide transport system substrate-binding subunit